MRQVLKRRGTSELGRSMIAYAVRAGANELTDLRRKQRRRDTLFADLTDDVLDVVEPRFSTEPEERHFDRIDWAEFLWPRIERAMSELSENQRRILQLRIERDLSYEEILVSLPAGERPLSSNPIVALEGRYKAAIRSMRERLQQILTREIIANSIPPGEAYSVEEFIKHLV